MRSRDHAVYVISVAAELAGIDLTRARVSAFTVSAAAAGAAGSILFNACLESRRL